MKVILDECLPKRLAGHISGHDVTTVPLAGLAGYSNGKLLAAVEERFDVFITIDGNLQWPQNLEGQAIIIVVVRAPSNRLEDLITLTPKIVEAIDSGSGVIRHVQ
tara:strand:- start:283 stop:597 length:315 start_codon:yes stop_codon:yes gene_type:complete